MLVGAGLGVYAAVWLLDLFIQFKAVVRRDLLAEIPDQLKHGGCWLRGRRDDGPAGEASAGGLRWRPLRHVDNTRHR